ncbi:MAG: hypothetical protein V7605_2773 [Acidimicrobiaceae bacterium]|jgi:hypothetical membrane protein
MSDRVPRLMSLAGIVGPAGFIGAWATSAALTAGYSSVHEAISELARVDAPARAVMTSGFVCFGVAVPIYAVALRRNLRGPAWVGAAVSGVATLGIALFPLGVSTRTDGVHNALAAVAYLSLVAAPMLALRPLIETGHCRVAALSAGVAGVAAGCLAATLLGPAHGLFQRSGLTLVDLWLMAGALIAFRRDQAHRPANS